MYKKLYFEINSKTLIDCSTFKSTKTFLKFLKVFQNNLPLGIFLEKSLIYSCRDMNNNSKLFLFYTE